MMTKGTRGACKFGVGGVILAIIAAALGLPDEQIAMSAGAGGVVGFVMWPVIKGWLPKSVQDRIETLDRKLKLKGK